VRLRPVYTDHHGCKLAEDVDLWVRLVLGGPGRAARPAAEAGQALDESLEDLPAVSREQAVAALRLKCR
jgi:hypothetical protein